MDPITPEDFLFQSSHQSQLESDEPAPAGTISAYGREIPLARYQTLERVIRDSPITVDPYVELAKIYLQTQRWMDAKRILDLAIEKFPDDEQANLLLEEAQINRSLQLLEEAKKAHAAEPTRLTLEAIERCNLELNVLREKICRKRLERQPSQTELFIPLAIALANLDRADEAVEYLSKAVHVAKLRATAGLLLGELLEKSNRIPEALSAYRRVALFRIPEPTHDQKVRALTSAANLAERCGMVDSALRYVQLLCALQPNHAALQQRLERLRATPL